MLIAGRSGSGKSTLAHCINGLIPFSYEGNSTGNVLIAGKDPREGSIFEQSKQVGTILQRSRCSIYWSDSRRRCSFLFRK